MVPDPKNTSVGMEYFCNEGDGTWTMSDEELIDLAGRELSALGLAKTHDVIDGLVTRQPKAYPIYDHEYEKHLEVIQDFLKTIDNLQTIGRNGMHRYNNMDHSIRQALDLATGEFVPGGVGSVVVECLGFVRSLPADPFS